MLHVEPSSGTLQIRLIAPAVLVLCGCASPWVPAADREAVWWADPSGIEAATGLDLVDLPRGQPLGYWPRLVLRRDGLDFDNRAWALSLPDATLSALDADERSALLAEGRDIVPLRSGRLDPEQLQGSLIPALFDRLLNHREDLIAFAETRDLEPPGTLVVVPDAAVSVETIQAALYSVAQAGMLDAYALAGASEGRLRSATASQPGSSACLRILLADLDADGVRLPLEGLPPLADAAGRCPLQPPDAWAVVADLQQLCRPLWLAAGADPATACIEVWPAPAGDLSAAVLLPALSGLVAHGPALALGPLLGRIRGPSSCEHALSAAAARPDQLSLLCGLTPDTQPVAAETSSQQPLFGQRGLGRRFHPLDAGAGPLSGAVAAAFPEYAAAETARRQRARAASGLPPVAQDPLQSPLEGP